MSGVESGGRSIEDGWAHGRVKEAELTTSKNDNEMFALKWDVTRGKEKATVFDNVVLTPNALWKAKTLLEACGVEVPDDDMELTEDMFVDLECDVEITNEEFEDKVRPRITGFRAPEGTDDEDEEDDDDEDEDEEEDEDEDDEEEAPPKKKGKKKPKPQEDDPEEDEEEDDSDDDDDEDDEDDEEESDDDDEDEDDEEEDEKPKKKSKKKAKKLRAGMKVKFKDDKDKARSGVITSIDGDIVYVEDSKQTEWELEEDEIELA
jgi:hypothetical protein